MVIGDWLTLFAVVVALGLGVSSIFQIVSMQKRERRERLLDEVKNWLLAVSSCVRSIEMVAVESHIGDLDSARSKLKIWIDEIGEIREKGIYIKQISLTFGEDCRISVDRVLETMSEHRDLLLEEIDSVKKTSKGKLAGSFDLEKVIAIGAIVRNQINTAIEDITSIKIKGLR